MRLWYYHLVKRTKTLSLAPEKSTQLYHEGTLGKCRKYMLQIKSLQVTATYQTHVSKFVCNCIHTRKRKSNAITGGALTLTHYSKYWEAKGYLKIRREIVIIRVGTRKLYRAFFYSQLKMHKKY